MRRTAPLIVGAGPAGCAAAITLAHDGVQPLVLERTRADADALCGGFLSWRTLAQLDALGVEVAGAPVTRLRVIAGGRVTEAELGTPALGLSRRALDAALRRRAETIGVGIERGAVVRAIEERHVRLADGRVMAPEALFLATGKHDIRGAARPLAHGDAAIGLRLRRATTSALEGVIELHLFRQGYAGVVLQEDGAANICMAVRKSRLDAAGGDPMKLLHEVAAEAPRLGERIGQIDGMVQAVANVPYGWRARRGERGMYRLGDQAGVIPSLAGEGISIALASGMHAARAWLDGSDGAAFQPGFARRLRRPIGGASALWHVAERPGAAALMTRILAAAPWAARAMMAATRIG
ncbi:NAD(P)/FAD-dependent oxidoreductase [Sphingomonas sp. ID0503]|uniref:NAD(P)/FAD-dependent oxidoreductase n=1 Tax=Sphingomonas sp. ID0503 TaxID=3399691 RepID=UPI003AFB4EF0